MALVELTSSTSGSVMFAGGFGVARSVSIGGSLTIAGSSVISGSLSTNSNNQASGNLSINGTNDSSSPTTGAKISLVGLGVGKSVSIEENLFVTRSYTFTGNFQFSSTAEAVLVNPASAVHAGGISVAKSRYVGTNLTDSEVFSFIRTSPFTNVVVSGSMVLERDLDMSGNINFGGTLFPTGQSVFAASATVLGH
ncbi:hypothetical protein BDK51DRAFT_39111 [Blyttiomyces helicus]|uniref:Uncharacterized protein n=1 Tax=Blyttiomyces helicus TaxID=388810 RepID=A0A4P9WS70_9FUNG|nr:hypothetical protein BDK51DRAFT_39111 [Blyttiomyces helicus]|eukprot:RKO94788.1 hypothetical protein BDK51DRAFT_39111 [Blyttiomyces helicus]